MVRASDGGRRRDVSPGGATGSIAETAANAVVPRIEARFGGLDRPAPANPALIGHLPGKIVVWRRGRAGRHASAPGCSRLLREGGAAHLIGVGHPIGADRLVAGVAGKTVRRAKASAVDKIAADRSEAAPIAGNNHAVVAGRVGVTVATTVGGSHPDGRSAKSRRGPGRADRL